MALLTGEIREQQQSVVQAVFVWFLRAMAAVAMIAGLSYWAQLIGLDNDSLPRFDRLPVHWKVPCVTLAVLLPVASMGLWTLTSWGIVLWTFACLIEISIYGIWADRYMSRPGLVAGLVGALSVLFVFIVILAVRRFRERLNEY
ncbi:DUF6163 family protein [Oricola thermophila]|uniref:DUF2069 domain-containing protein n=1 Tax=Oricola thermophila TaxID=2742145 RepID=A0A6N1VBH7_9HYPH|nr:DUF6163 family protein [Oricola thermophila]QKV18346.1 hypothetical protein HTY61_07705 [Oricola thermophila]